MFVIVNVFMGVAFIGGIGLVGWLVWRHFKLKKRVDEMEERKDD